MSQVATKPFMISLVIAAGFIVGSYFVKSTVYVDSQNGPCNNISCPGLSHIDSPHVDSHGWPLAFLTVSPNVGLDRFDVLHPTVTRVEFGGLAVDLTAGFMLGVGVYLLGSKLLR